MHKLTLSLAAALSLTTIGCKNKNDALAKLQGFQKAMCDCKDRSCAEKVNIDLATWRLDLAKAAAKDEKPDPAMASKSGEVMTKYADCAAKLLAGAVTNATSETPAGSGKCPDGFTQKTSFCIKLPPGVVGDGGSGMAVGDGKSMQYGWPGGDKGNDFGITVVVSAKNEYYDATVKDVKTPSYQGKAIADGKVGDVGAWGSGEDGPPPAGYAQRHYIKSVTRNDKQQLTCSTTRANGTGAPSEDQVFEACKTIQFAQ
jgi:hypothetical protein